MRREFVPPEVLDLWDNAPVEEVAPWTNVGCALAPAALACIKSVSSASPEGTSLGARFLWRDGASVARGHIPSRRSPWRLVQNLLYQLSR